MKQFIISTMLLIFAVTSFSQQTNSSQTLTREDYLKKSKTQKIAAWILVGAGATMFAVAASGNNSFGTTGALVIAAGVAVLGSIPLFIASGSNKRKALNASAYFKFEKTPSVQQTWTTSRSYPAISLKIHL